MAAMTLLARDKRWTVGRLRITRFSTRPLGQMRDSFLPSCAPV
jgi:hypothetical protein